jgi:hypothetical protein
MMWEEDPRYQKFQAKMIGIGAALLALFAIGYCVAERNWPMLKTIGGVLGLILVFVIYVAWFNGAFLRCPHCRKIAMLRNSGERAIEEKDEEGDTRKITRIRICRRCGEKVVDRWSDYEGRSLTKVDEGG